MVYDFKTLRPSNNNPPYPPYHTGKYLEEYFYDFYKVNQNEFNKTGRTLIPIFWTNLYLNNFSTDTIQRYVDALPGHQKYFTVSQFDDGITQQLPPDTLNFVAGGNMDGIAIPLICSPIPREHITPTSKDIFCSFVGTYVNSEKYKCRISLYTNHNSTPGYYFSKPRHWNKVVDSQSFDEFINVTKRSKFTLCPRGYGKQSFRLYEAMQLGSIPVVVYDDKFLPFESFIDWNSFSVLVHETQIPQLNDMLNSYSDVDIIDMLQCGKEIYNTYFTLEGTCKTILKHLQTHES